MTALADRWDSLLGYWWHYTMLGVAYDPGWLLGKAQMLQESAGDPFAESSAGAIGLFQLMPETAREVNVSDPRNPEQSIQGGLKYLRRCYDVFTREKDLERWRFGLAAYNCGMGNVVKAQELASKRGYDTTRWVSIVQVLADITGHDNAFQTVNYVARIMVSYDQLQGEQS